MRVYADNNATTRVADEVMAAMLPFFTEKYANPSSMYAFALEAKRPMEEAREQVAGLINAAHADEIIFTSCGTESDNAAIFGVLEAQPRKRHVIMSAVEHPAVYNLTETLRRHGVRVTHLSVNGEGLVDVEELRHVLSDDTALVSVMWANNETGVLSPMEEICGVAHERGVIVHTDAVQAVGKVPVDVQKVPVDLLSLSGHKFHAPKGVGALYVKRGTRLRPFFVGGHQEHGRRAGTENVPSIVGLGKAAELAQKFLGDEVTRVRGLRDRFEREILARVPYTRVNGHRTLRTPNTTSISFAYVEGEAILLSLSDEGICASSGSACTSGSLEPSHVLRAMGLSHAEAHGTVRFSFSRYTTDAEIDYMLERIPPVIARLRELSPFYPG
ncbi:MAG: cysteine desulfurase NifS [bacterium]|nr:cysteine desulfurase NifS [bacterium]